MHTVPIKFNSNVVLLDRDVYFPERFFNKVLGFYEPVNNKPQRRKLAGAIAKHFEVTEIIESLLQ